MKNKNKTIVEPKKGSLSKKIGRLVVIVVLYIAIVSTLAFIMSTITLIVNADSINDTPDYQYLKTSYYNWDNITWYTDDNTFVTGSNDTFSTLTTWSDYYQISQIVDVPSSAPSDLTGYTISIPTGWTVTAGFGRFSLIGYANWIGEFSMQGFGVGVNKAWTDSSTNCAITTNLSSPDNTNTFSKNNSNDILLTITGGADVTNQNLIQWFVDNNATFTHNTGGASIDDEISLFAEETEYYIINRSNVYNHSLSTIDTFVYDSLLNTDLIFNSIVFEKSNYFLKVGDLNRIGSPMISASVLNGGFDLTFDIEGYRKDSEGNITNLSIVTNSRVDVLGYQFLYPSKTELFGNIDNLTDNDMLYIKNLRVLVEFPNNYVDNLSYRYGVDSIEKNSLDYNIAFSSWVNQSSIANIGSDLLSSVNGFLAFELVPGLSLMSILILLVVIPLLIWILRLFLGG